ncbi:MAG: hypothetical protein P1U63_04570 [Coxiellaceae bacterium]|nr:hypothetical protein [Coxiellaceae bacterium]
MRRSESMVRTTLDMTRLLVTGVPRQHFSVSAATSFNYGTMQNVLDYMTENKGKIIFESNPSGFIRTQLPDDALVPDSTVAPLAEGERLRANFWYLDSSEHHKGDESIHDHPSPFTSFIVQGGYEHALYRVLFNGRDVITHDNWCNAAKASVSTFKFAIDKNEFGRVTYKGEVVLEKTGLQQVKGGDTVVIDDKMIHRVTRFRLFPSVPTLSFNIVRNGGDGVTNIFLPEHKEASVETVRHVYTATESEEPAKEMRKAIETRLLSMN